MKYSSITLFWKMFLCKLSKLNLIKAPKPITLTFSVTNRCQSRCKTCFIWNCKNLNSALAPEKELNLKEIEKIFKSIGRLFFFNISGGEPYLRNDLPQICELAVKYLKPSVIHIPTNAISPELVEDGTRKILEIIKKHNPHIRLTIKPSFDGINEKHDEIRGIKGNFKSLLETLACLKKLQKTYSNLDVGLGTVISKYNLKDIPEITAYAKKLALDSYINEIAEQRSELFTENKDITPTPEEYQNIIKYFSDMKLKKSLSKTTQAFRLVYYALVTNILKQKKQLIPCYAGISNAHLTPYGDIWPCCIRGYSSSFGNLRKLKYTFNKVWHSKEAEKIRKQIKNKECYCPLANQAYSNILFNPLTLFKVFKNILLR